MTFWLNVAEAVMMVVLWVLLCFLAMLILGALALAIGMDRPAFTLLAGGALGSAATFLIRRWIVRWVES